MSASEGSKETTTQLVLRVMIALKKVHAVLLLHLKL